ncbi:MAG: indole-3-glycerol phosphate synthase [SAR324 cluster bacterium]|uniref:Indole-3-glycerol phosphate synthase n=1 Tax=SAR324 cluster bacterium TaxID=2024889 RepID=A0A2A4SX51_9DELT|nr:MAG: indole-3-glycerol phosphate synthase [SAR324 cluster bacterium]
MNILDKINRDKQAEVDQTLKHISPADLHKKASDTRIPLDFRAALQKPGLSIIAEVKKASPSKGIIRPDFHPVEFAKSYARHQANCISILTEEKYFQGHPNFLRDIRKEVNIPLLRKDFIVDPRQIRDSYDLGADAILLIVASLKKEQILEFQQLAQEFGLTCLVEVHTQQELEVALQCESKLIGVNNRNLSTFETDIQNSIDLRQEIPSDVTCVSESGIHSTEHCDRLNKHGFDAILVGETLMRQEDPGLAISELLGKNR